MSYEKLKLDPARHECCLNGEPISLTPAEFSILRILLENSGTAVSIEDLFRLVWKNECCIKNSSTMTVHIRYIREKLHDAGEELFYIKTVWGVGYRI